MKLEPLALGAITYLPKRDERTQDFFETRFLIECTDDGEFGYENEFEVGVSVPAEGRDRPYGEIEEAGVLLLPAFFRDLADQIEKDIDRATRERAAKPD